MNQSSQTPITPSPSFPDLTIAKPSICKGRHLPMWEVSRAIYHVALHLADSVPQAELDRWREERASLNAELELARAHNDLTQEAAIIASMHSVYNNRVERYLSAGYGESLLSNPHAAQGVIETLTNQNGIRYALHAYCVMPNHIHVIIGNFADCVNVKTTLESIKRASAHRINLALCRKGSVWHRDIYSHIIRSAKEYRQQLSYVWMNPEKAGLISGFSRQRYVAW